MKKNEMPAVDRAWQARSDLDALRRAGEVMRDRGRMAAAKREAKREVKAMQKIPGLGLAGKR